MLNNISSLHYITQDLPDTSHSELVLKACDAGIDWVQLRIKNKSFNEWLKISEEVKLICSRYHVKLIINDQVGICKLIEADGVHLGRNDMNIIEARKTLGEKYIIGGTANNYEEVKNLVKNKVDYIGLGPFRFTHTKENLSPVLGLSGMVDIVENLKDHPPIIGIGGIKIEDLKDLFKIGLHGIAVSSAINHSGNIDQSVKNFKKEINQIKHEQISYSR